MARPLTRAEDRRRKEALLAASPPGKREAVALLMEFRDVLDTLKPPFFTNEMKEAFEKDHIKNLERLLHMESLHTKNARTQCSLGMALLAALLGRMLAQKKDISGARGMLESARENFQEIGVQRLMENIRRGSVIW